MTRETKIGLLVGLAFIIVIGILLSDHLTSSTEPPQAVLGGAGNGVRQAVGSPGSNGATSPVMVVTPVVTPQQPVATQAEVTTPAPAVQFVKIGGPEAPAPQSTETAKTKTETASPVATNDQPVITPVVPPVVANVTTPPATTDSDLSKVAEAHGETLVSADTKSSAGSSQEYVAQPGDSLSRIASKFLGNGSKPNRDLIVKVNPSLQGNENMIIAGKTYQIPTAEKAPAKAVSTVSTSTDDTAPTVDESTAKTASAKQEKLSKAATDAGYLYTVQPGDNLTRIARDEVGDVHAVAAIRELNPDKLKGTNHDMVIAGSKIRLPGKPLAKAE